jgi:hypothetical protein
MELYGQNLASDMLACLQKNSCQGDIPQAHLLDKVESLTKYLRRRFKWKLTASEKSLHTQLRDALNDDRYEHSGTPRLDGRDYWPVGKTNWSSFSGNLQDQLPDATTNYPAPSIRACPDDGRMLPRPSDLRPCIDMFFVQLQKKIGFLCLEDWLKACEEYAQANLSIDNPDTPGVRDDNVQITDTHSGIDFDISKKKALNLLGDLKPKYQSSFKRAYIWYKDTWPEHGLGLKELGAITGLSISTLQEHFKKHIKPKIIEPLKDTGDLVSLFEYFREHFSQFNPENTESTDFNASE